MASKPFNDPKQNQLFILMKKVVLQDIERKPLFTLFQSNREGLCKSE